MRSSRGRKRKDGSTRPSRTLAEDIHGFSTSNIDYRVSAFLSRPEHYQLVVDDYFAADLFRSHGNRGSTYLFLRWCADRYGPGLIDELVRSPRQGVANVEAATGTTFTALYRRWSVALFTSGLDPAESGSDAGGDGFCSTNLRSPWSDWEMAGPRYSRVSPGGPADCWEAMGTSSHYIVIDGSPMGAVEIEVAGPSQAEIQVTALPLGDDQARLSLALESSPGPSGELGIRARVAERNGVPVRLSALSWEPLVPGPRPHVDGRHTGRLDILGLAVTLGTSAIPSGGELRSGTIRLSGISRDTGPIVIKVVGTDRNGRRISAWADVNGCSPSRPDDP